MREMLGHAHIATTEIYTRVSIRQLQRVYAATHPAAFAERHRPGSGDEHRSPREDVAGLLTCLAAEAAEDDDSQAHHGGGQP